MLDASRSLGDAVVSSLLRLDDRHCFRALAVDDEIHAVGIERAYLCRQSSEGDVLLNQPKHIAKLTELHFALLVGKQAVLIKKIYVKFEVPLPCQIVRVFSRYTSLMSCRTALTEVGAPQATIFSIEVSNLNRRLNQFTTASDIFDVTRVDA
jgi:hypothetical protein